MTSFNISSSEASQERHLKSCVIVWETVSLVPLGLIFLMASLSTVTAYFNSPVYSLLVQTEI